MNKLSVFLFAVSMFGQAKPEAPKVHPLSEVQQLKVENLQLQMELIDTRRQAISNQLTAIVTEKCIEIGGKVLTDCQINPPKQQGEKVTLHLLPKPEAKK